MKQYLDLMRQVHQTGTDRMDRTGVGTRSIFGYQMRFNLQEGFPLVTTKRCHMHSIVHELLWFLQGKTNVKDLQKNKVRIWDAWAQPDGELGPIYGKQWRAWTSPQGNIDQIAAVLAQLQADPYSRRMLVVAWNVGDLSQMALPPCHVLFQFYVADGQLSCQLYQRSCDLFLGVPFNIASYALLVSLICDQVGLSVGEFIWTGGDIHIYHNHFDAVLIQLERTPKPLPTLKILKRATSLEAYQAEDISLLNYDAYPVIRAPIAV